MAEIGTGGHQRRIARTRARVLRAAHAVLLEYGFDLVTIDHISDRSGVSRSTIYRHWDSREEILRDAFTFVALGSRPRGPDLTEDLRAYLEAFADGLTNHWGRAAATMAISALDHDEQRTSIATFRDGYVADITEIAKAAVERGELAPEVLRSSEQIADDAVAPLFYNYLISHKPLSHALIDTLVTRTVAALCAEHRETSAPRTRRKSGAADR